MMSHTSAKAVIFLPGPSSISSAMPPLTRQPTYASIHSWWSDSNPGLQGPTINIHAAARPLIKLMYHRQASSFIKQNSNIPLSDVALEIYSTYLS